MKLAKSAALVLGLAASGGLLMILSGSAYAADGGTNTSTQSTQTVVTSTSSVTQENTSTAAPSQKTTAGSGELVITAPVQENAALEPATQTEPLPAKGSVPALATAAPDGAAPTAIKSSGAAELAVSKGEVADVSSAVAASPAAAKVLPLRIQPVITNSWPVPVADLAASLPSAASKNADGAVPVPAQPSGVLGRLTAQLAGLIVQPLFLSMLDFTGLTATYTLLILLATVVGRYIFAAFRLSTRRDGFAHAARSDVAVATLNFLFATPFPMSYLLAPSPERYSFLMVSEKNYIICGPQRYQKGGK